MDALAQSFRKWILKGFNPSSPPSHQFYPPPIPAPRLIPVKDGRSPMSCIATFFCRLPLHMADEKECGNAISHRLKKIERDPRNPEMIVTITGCGYEFAAALSS